MKIKYIGAFLNISAEEIPFVRHIPVEVDEDVGQKLLAARISGQPIFVDCDAKPAKASKSEAEPALAVNSK